MKNNHIVTILGSGTCVPSLSRSSCAVVLQTGGEYLLFDLGPGTTRRLLEAGIDIFDITHIFISHFHPDHTGELVSFLFSSKYPDEHRRKLPLTICAGAGFSAFFEQLKGIYKEWIDLSGRITLMEFDSTSRDFRQFQNFTVNTCPVNHRQESIAYRITVKNGASMVYSGDTDYSENLIDLAQNTDLFICESSLPDYLKVEGHLTPSLAGKIASLANVKKLALTHFYPACDPAEMKAQCRATFKGELELACDLMSFQLESPS